MGFGLSTLLGRKSGKGAKVKARIEAVGAQAARDRDALKAELDALRVGWAKPGTLADAGAIGPDQLLALELAACRRLAPQTRFVMGFARSCTSMTAVIVNMEPRCLLLGEASLYLRRPEKRFSEHYNRQHRGRAGHRSKLRYAPDLLPGRDHFWWEWLAAAAEIYELVGDKATFNAQNFRHVPYERVIAFFEARFLAGRYFFLFREPVQNLVSVTKLFQREDDAFIVEQMWGWTQFVLLWAQMACTFPHTMTAVIHPGRAFPAEALGRHFGMDLAPYARMWQADLPRTFPVPAEGFAPLREHRAELDAIFAAIEEAMAPPSGALPFPDQQLEAAGLNLPPRPITMAYQRAKDLAAKLEAIRAAATTPA